jgi:hypothetical protein
MRAESARRSRSDSSSTIAPRFEHTINLIANRGASLVAIVAAHQELIVPRMKVANVRDYGEARSNGGRVPRAASIVWPG